MCPVIGGGNEDAAKLKIICNHCIHLVWQAALEREMSIITLILG